MDTTGRLLSLLLILFFQKDSSNLRSFSSRVSEEIWFLKPIFRFAKKQNTVNKIKIFQKGLKYFFQNQIF